jgi:hypothetical protein
MYLNVEEFQLLSRVGVSLDGVSDWIADLLTTSGSPPQAFITAPLNHTLQISL